MNVLAASWVMQGSLDPPLVMIAVRKPSRTYDLVKSGWVFSVNLADKPHRRIVARVGARPAQQPKASAAQRQPEMGDGRWQMADGKWQMANPAQGETLELERHHQRADVKAVTLRRFRLEHTGEGWVAEVILDR